MGARGEERRGVEGGGMRRCLGPVFKAAGRGTVASKRSCSSHGSSGAAPSRAHVSGGGAAVRTRALAAEGGAEEAGCASKRRLRTTGKGGRPARHQNVTVLSTCNKQNISGVSHLSYTQRILYKQLRRQKNAFCTHTLSQE